jgi:superfamily II DNA helicase RecQ
MRYSSRKPAPAPRQASDLSPDPAEDHARSRDYQRAVAQLILHAAEQLVGFSGKGVTPRAVVNYLRGNQLPSSRSSEAGKPRSAGLPDFGTLAVLPANWLHQVVEGLVEEGYLSREIPKGATTCRIEPSATGKEALRERHDFPRKIFAGPAVIGTFAALETPLFELRKELAQAEGRPAFGVFSNSVIAALAARDPRGLDDLAEVPGLGEARIRKYGRKIIAALRRARGA